MDSSYNIKSFTVAMIKVVPLIEARSPTRVRAQLSARWFIRRGCDLSPLIEHCVYQDTKFDTLVFFY